MLELQSDEDLSFNQQEVFKEIQVCSEAQDANDAKTEFLTYISHELRNPAGVMISIANILSKTAPLTSKQKELIAALQLSGEMLVSLLNDFLDITKIEDRHINLEKIPFSLYQLMQDINQMMSPNARSHGLEFAMHCDSVKNETYTGDPARLRQMILNLCSNAIKFTDKGTVQISVQKTAAQISISVRDTGMGISGEDQKKIFEKFSQADSSINRKFGGTGMGLLITKKLAEAMNGSIEVMSTPEVGSTFTLYLPLVLYDESTKNN